MFDLTHPSLQVCQTPACIHTAETIKKNIDFNIDPCTDFYRYSCGGWIDSHELPPDRSNTGILSDIQYNNEQIVYDILHSTFDNFTRNVLDDAKSLLIEQDIDRSNFNMVQSYYLACMDEERLAALGPSPIYQALAELLAKRDLTDILTYLSKTALEPLFGTIIGPDGANPAVNILSIDQPYLLAPSIDYYTDTAFMEKYQSAMVDLVESVVGTNVNEMSLKESKRVGFTLLEKPEIEARVKDFMAMETMLAGLRVKEEDHIDAVRNYNPRRLVDFKKAYPFVHWHNFFRQLLPHSIPVPETVVVSAVPYFDNLARWFQSSPPANTTRLLKNYFLVRYIYSKSSQLDFKINDLKFAISKGVFNGVYTNPPQWRRCMSSTTSTFGPILSRYFVMIKFGGEGKRKRVLDFITLIHQSWERRLKALTWLDKNTLDMALDKLHKILQQAGYGVVEPDLRSPSSLQSFYDGLVINKDTYFKNVENANLWSNNYEWKQLERPPNKDDFEMNSMDVNAYYSAYENQIAVSAGIITDPFYNDQVPDYLNFGGLGLVVGHELTHAFDNKGRVFNGDGKLDDWWTQSTALQFRERSKCFVNQYWNFTATDGNGKVYHTNGNLTLSENLADNVGLSVAYDAYKTLEKTKSQQSLPGLDLTPEQLFYVNYARSWCGKLTPAYEVSLILSDEHAIQKARINGVIQNSLDFAKHFKCPSQSPMNPSTKCSVW